MKKLILSAFALVALGTWVTSCKKDQITEPIKQVITELAADETPDAVVDSLGDFLDNPMIVEATEFSEVEIISVPEVLFSDYFTFVETRTGKRDSLLKACSGLVKVTRENREALAKAHEAKMACMKENREMLHKIDSLAKASATDKRQQLMQNYKNELNEIGIAYRSGKITEKERDAQMAAARARLDEALSKLGGETRDKLKSSKDRAESAGKIKDCERIYMKQVHEIIGKDNYALWIKCHKMNFRRKHK